MQRKRKIILIIQDGWGIAPLGPGNFISLAKTPNFNSFLKHYPHSQNKASGEAVGLPKGVQGNSEVGHLHLGAGRIVWQMYELINREINNGEFFKNKEINKAMDKAKENNSALHLMGLCSDEGVHAHTGHLFALLKIAQKKKLKKVYIHFFADGRDVPEKSAMKYIDLIEEELDEIKIGKITSIVGRYYSMDRDNNWERTKEAYDMLTKGDGIKAKTARQAISLAYARGDKTDYYIRPTVLDGFEPIKDKDVVIFFNFRTDRPRQLTRALTEKNFNKFKREIVPKPYFLAMTQYDKKIKVPHAYKEEEIKNNLGIMLSNNNLLQLRIAETEKYAHVTYFFNSQLEKPNKGEKRIMIPSAKVPSYDQKPEMSAYEIKEEVIRQINSKKYDFILLNFANCDLVGHSAVKPAIIKCVEIVDQCTGEVVKIGLENNYTIIITADHGSAEDKLYPNGTPKPAHSTNPVNFILISKEKTLQKIKLKNGSQTDVAPTILNLMGIQKPREMTGKPLF